MRNLHAWVILLTLLAALAASWAYFGLSLYEGAIPFYDSLAYQNGYRDIALIAGDRGALGALAYVWNETGNNVVLYRFFSAAVSRVFPSPIDGLFIYLLGIHLLAAVALAKVVRTATGQWAPVFFSLAVAFSTTPFGIVRGGIGDQRMDLSAGSAYLLVVALGLLWIHRPSALTAFSTGLAAAAACLHRPIIAPSLVVVAVLLIIFGAVRNRQPSKDWVVQTIAASLPLGAVAAPWFIKHLDSLLYYYTQYGPTREQNVSWTRAVDFNFGWFLHNIGWWSAGILFLGLILISIHRRIRFPDIGLVIVFSVIPVAVLVVTKFVNNAWVQQMCITIPALLFTAFHRDNQSPPLPRWLTGLSIASLVGVVALTVFRLDRDLAKENPHAKSEVVAVLRAINAIPTEGKIAGFHDLPVSVSAMVTIAENEGLPFREGTQSFYPTDFGLPKNFVADSDPVAVRRAFEAHLQSIKTGNQIVLLPTLDTKHLLWAGLFSHRKIPLIRELLMSDPAYQYTKRVGPVQGVYFDVFLINPALE